MYMYTYVYIYIYIYNKTFYNKQEYNVVFSQNNS